MSDTYFRALHPTPSEAPTPGQILAMRAEKVLTVLKQLLLYREGCSQKAIAEALAELMRLAREEQRLGVPVLGKVFASSNENRELHRLLMGAFPAA